MTALTCQICYQSAGDRPIELCCSCGEDFHRDCIESSIIRVGGKNSCPICKDRFYRLQPEIPQEEKKEPKVYVDMEEYELGSDDERAGWVMIGVVIYLVGLIILGTWQGFFPAFLIFILSIFGYLAYSALVTQDLR